MSCGNSNIVDSGMSSLLVALEKREGLSSARSEAKMRKVGEGDGSLPHRRAHWLSPGTIFQDT